MGPQVKKFRDQSTCWYIGEKIERENILNTFYPLIVTPNWCMEKLQ
jgi:hypothetical protein